MATIYLDHNVIANIADILAADLVEWARRVYLVPLDRSKRKKFGVSHA